MHNPAGLRSPPAKLTLDLVVHNVAAVAKLGGAIAEAAIIAKPSDQPDPGLVHKHTS